MNKYKKKIDKEMICLHKTVRGVSLLEGVLYIGLALSLLGFVAALTRDQQVTQENLQAAGTLRDLTDASQLYLSGEYDQIREALIGGPATPAATPLEAVYSIDDIANLGYFPGTLVPGGVFTDIFEQNYAILVRGVDAGDINIPQVTLTRGAVVDGTGNIDPVMIDGDPANGEYELEAVLVSYGGAPVPQLRLGPISNATGRSGTGILAERLAGAPDSFEAIGPRGGFQFDLTGFSETILAAEGVPEFPQPEGGRFVSLVALSNYGALTAGGLVPGEDGRFDGVFLRCEQILETPGLDQNSPEYQDCLNTNEVYDEIVFNNDFDPTFRSAIREVDTIQFTNNASGEIRNLSSIDCGTPSGIPTSLNQLRVNCAVLIGSFDPALISPLQVGDVGIAGNTRINGALRVDNAGGTVDSSIGGTLNVENNLNVSNDLTVGGNTRLDNQAILSSLDGGQDAREGIFNSYRQGSDTTIPKPICPVGFTPSVSTAVAGYADPQGRASVGVITYTEDEVTDWRLRMVMFLDEDVCNNAAQGVLLDPTLAPSNPANGCAGGDGLADGYQVPAANGLITAQTQCIIP